MYWTNSVNDLVENVEMYIFIEFEGNVSMIFVTCGISENKIKVL